ncbi:MAG TPA: hypothetical protein VD994_19640, partial [Prosthecobacter sp.]|nr:hypothetical protein [Prosthecobacter sp.]
LKLDAEREVHAKRAITNAPESLEPLLSYIHGRLATARIAPTILRLLNEPVPDRVAFDRETLRLLDRAVLLAKDEPAVLGAIGFIQLQMKIATLQAAAARAVRPPPPDSPPNRVPPPPPVKIEQRALPVFAKLRDLIDKSPEAAKSAAATEAFAGLLALIHLSGATTTPVAELPRLVEAAIGQAPERPLLWDLWLDQKFAAAARGELSGEELRQLAQRRLKQMPTGRSHAMVAFASRGEEARVAWLEAAKVEPSNIEFLLNLAATMLSDNQNPQTIDSAIAIVQRATQLSYQDVSWQKPRLDAFRLRTYAVCLILKGDTERAHALLIERLKEFPGDIASKAIRDALVSE